MWLNRMLHRKFKLERNKCRSAVEQLHICHLRLFRVQIKVTCTVNVCRMSHRKWRETNQQLIRLPDLALLGCSLLSPHFLCGILTTHPVTLSLKFSTTSSSSLPRIFFYVRAMEKRTSKPLLYRAT